MADIFVSKPLLPQALTIANQFYQHLVALGYQIGFGPSSGRSKLLYCEGASEHEYYQGNWHPSRPTVVQIGTLELGLTIFELSEMAEAEYVNGKYVRVSDLPPSKQRQLAARSQGWGPYKHPCLTGRLAVQAFSPYPAVPWERRWVEPEPGALPGMFDEIARSLRRQASLLVPQVKEARERARREAEQHEAARQEWLRRRAIEEEEQRKAAEARARAKAIEDSKQALMGLIQRWNEAKRVSAFLAELDEAVSDLPQVEQGPLQERIRKAKAFLGETDILGSIRNWQTPEERYTQGK